MSEHRPAMQRMQTMHRYDTCIRHGMTAPRAVVYAMLHAVLHAVARAVRFALMVLGWGAVLHAVAHAAGMLAPVSSTAAVQAPYTLRIVGGLAGVNQYTRQEEPFWTRDLARLSGGKFSADIVPFERAGVPGSDMLRLLQLGVVPFGTALMSSFTAQYPEYTAPDLAGLNPDIATLKNAVEYRPLSNIESH